MHPAAGEPLRALALGALVALCALWAARTSGSPAFALACAGLLAFSLRAFFLPRTYRLDAEGASERGPFSSRRRLAWDRVRRISGQRFGVYLSPLHGTSRLLPDRGLFLRTAGNRDEVTAFVHARVGPS